MAIGLSLGGLRGAGVAWLGFTLPSAILMAAFGLGMATVDDVSNAPWLLGLKIVTVAIVAQAVMAMAKSLCPDRTRATFAVVGAVIVIALSSAWAQVLVIAIGGVAGWLLIAKETGDQPRPISIPINRSIALACLVGFFVLLIGLPIAAQLTSSETLQVFESFYRAGALVFGGGHVVLPLLQENVVAPGWVENSVFLAGYGAAQAVPGPLFTFSAYLGAVMNPAVGGILGAILCLVAIFLPAALLIIGALPFWTLLRGQPAMQAAMKGINAVVVGLLLAALYDPVWITAIRAPADFALAIVAFLLLEIWRLPPWLVVAFGAIGGYALVLF
jgi:chromate transporter